MAFSSLTMKELQDKFKEYEVEDYAQAGAKASYTVFLEKGKSALEAYSHSMETQFRTLGLPTNLNMGKIELESDVYVCKTGTTLSVE